MSILVDNPELCAQPLLPYGDAVQASEAKHEDWLGHRLLEAMKPFIPTLALATPEGPLGGDAGSPAERVLSPSPPDMTAALLAVEHATSEEEAMGAVGNLVTLVESAVAAGADPIAVLLSTFGFECVATISEAYASAVVELEAEAAAAGGQITERAANRIAHRMIRRVTTPTSVPMRRPLHLRRVLRGRAMHVPRARRAHRRAVRLSAVASAGDGPSPEGPHAPIRACISRVDDAGLSDVVQIDDDAVCIVDLLEQADGEYPTLAALALQRATVPRTRHDSGLRRLRRRVRAPPRNAMVTPLDGRAALRVAAERVGRGDGRRRSTIGTRDEALRNAEVP